MEVLVARDHSNATVYYWVYQQTTTPRGTTEREQAILVHQSARKGWRPLGTFTATPVRKMDGHIVKALIISMEAVNDPDRGVTRSGRTEAAGSSMRYHRW